MAEVDYDLFADDAFEDEEDVLESFQRETNPALRELNGLGLPNKKTQRTVDERIEFDGLWSDEEPPSDVEGEGLAAAGTGGGDGSARGVSPATATTSYALAESAPSQTATPKYVYAGTIRATRFDGRPCRFTCRKRSEEYDDAVESRQDASKALNGMSVLSRPFATLVLEIEREKEARKQTVAKPVKKQHRPSNEVLWTHKYRPQKFVDLFGDERVHRQALAWLKEWDQCVFKTSERNMALKIRRDQRKRRWGDNEPEVENTDPWGRPFQRMLLLSGPPGSGKTTLAHVIARQAGYQVHEINASDDRTGRVVEERILNALESNALGKSTRPTCLVIDEIDGVAGGGEASFVKALIKLVGEENSNYRNRKKNKKKPILRPIICICNDLYASSLKLLRPVCLSIRFNRPSNLQLAQKLKAICDAEHLKAEAKYLGQVVELSNADLRSCLNTLQFINRNSKIVNDESIKSTDLGKDAAASSPMVVQSLFVKPRIKKGLNWNPNAYVDRIVRAVQTCGEFDKILHGCFDNYLTARLDNDLFPKLHSTMEFFTFFDRIDKQMKTEHDYDLYAYMPYCFAPWYTHFANHDTRAMESSRADYEAYMKTTAFKETAHAFEQGLSHHTKTLFTGHTITTELIPYINRIITPDIRPINRQFMKETEKKLMKKLVDVLISMNITFVSEKKEDGQLAYKIEPPIDVFVHYDGKRAEDIPAARYATRHIARMETLDRKYNRTEGGEGTTSASLQAAYAGTAVSDGKASTKEAMDFFGRVVVVSESAEEAVERIAKKRKLNAVYKYHEGFSNAVKITKKLADFMVL